NSGADAVVEGIGDHGCEYMTGGRVVILGPTGRNFGAGMSGGVGFVYDLDRTFSTRYNSELVDLEIPTDEDRDWLRSIITRHLNETGSEVANEILSDWDVQVEDFVKVMPRDFRRVMETTRLAEAQGRSVDEAVMEAAHG
ncbi:MAG: hypothetical protein M1121_04185, partial [Actinobacteria bacterium]|nr:hypothetical protein [Actinomycetota bacterium]